MKYHIVQPKISVDKCDLIILSGQISHQPIRQLVHGRNVSGCSGFVLLCPRGHLLMQSTSAALSQEHFHFTSTTSSPTCLLQ